MWSNSSKEGIFKLANMSPALLLSLLHGANLQCECRGVCVIFYDHDGCCVCTGNLKVCPAQPLGKSHYSRSLIIPTSSGNIKKGNYAEKIFVYYRCANGILRPCISINLLAFSLETEKNSQKPEIWGKILGKRQRD